VTKLVIPMQNLLVRFRLSRPVPKRMIYLLFAWLAAGSGEVTAAVLKGKAAEAGGMPVAGKQLFFMSSASGQRLAVTTDRDGNFALDLPGGKYRLVDSGASGPEAGGITLAENEVLEITVLIAQDGGIRVVTRQNEAAGMEKSEQFIDPYLRAIRDYRIESNFSGSAESKDARKLAELVNPFPAQNHGWFHGSVYEFHRNDNFDARNFFDPVGEPLPEYKRNQFGASIGAVIGRGMNLHFTYDGLRIVQGSTLLSHIPTAAMKRGDFGAIGIPVADPQTGELFESGRIPESRISAVSKRLLVLLPDPNREDGDRNFVNNKPIVRQRDTYSFRGDHQLKNGSSWLARYSNSNASDVGVSALPAFGYEHEGSEQDFTASYSLKFSGRLLANLQASFGRTIDFTGSVNAGRAGLLESLGINGLGPVDPSEEGYPGFALSGYSSFGDSGLPYTSTNNRIGYDGSITFTPQKHSFRAGAGLTFFQSNNNRSDGLRKGRFTFNGYYTGDAFADFLLGLPDSASRAIGTDRADLRRQTLYFFARDDWKLNQRLTLSWGLTYNYYQPFYSIRRNVSTFYPLVFDPPLSGEIVVAGSSRARQLGLAAAGDGGMLFPDFNDWAPSTGFAYRPLGGGKMVLRGYYGLSYAPIGRDSFVANLNRNYPFFYTESAISSPDRPEINLDSPFISAAAAALGVRGIDPHLRTAYVGSWGLNLQSELFQQWHLEAAYSGSKATRLARNLVANVPFSGPDSIQPRRPNPGYGRFTILTGSGSSTRNAVSLDVERRMADGISFKAGSSWSAVISDTFYGNPSNPRNLAAERARSEVPARLFYMNYIFDLPIGKGGYFLKDASSWLQPILAGWRLSGITYFQDGGRFSVVSAGDPNNDGVADERPDRIGSGELDDSRKGIDQWFATADFTSPAAYSYGNSGRNILTAPPYVNWDLSVIKQTRIKDEQMIEFRVELFNAFNQVNFEPPSPVFGTSVFGKIFGARRAREIEVALRYGF
jgi:hypothetical protein